ncbi:Carbohydrate kinase, FGGY, conserved site-containing protein, partial [Cynara cardunculus var. scolymus]
MHKDAGEKEEIKNETGQLLLRVDGGAIVNKTLMQIQHAFDDGKKPPDNAIGMMVSRIKGKLEKELSKGKTHFLESCGLPISTYFSALKLLWLLENVDVVKDAVKKGDALFGTIDSWLIWNLTRGVDNGVHVTDVSNASRTMLMILKTLNWDGSTLETLKIPKEILPKIMSNAEVIGHEGKGWLIPRIPISGCLGDQHAAMLGQSCRKGEAKSTYGTGAFILLNTGEEAIQSTHGLLTTLAFKIGKDAPTNDALQGSIAIAGAVVPWLRDSLGSEIEDLASKVDSTGGVYFVPAFNGLFAPWWRDDARGVCIGITRFTNKSHIVRAVLESMCFQVKNVLDSMHKDAGEKGELKNEKGQFLLRVDRGATVNNTLMQIQRPANIVTTALGAAYAAGLAVGVWTEEEIFSNGERMKKDTTFNPVLNEKLRKKKVASWCKAVEKTFDLADFKRYVQSIFVYITSVGSFEDLASKVDSTGGVYFVPAFNGLFAPWWRDDAGGVCIGFTRLTKESHIARAVLEIKDVLDSIHKDVDEKGEIKNEKGQLLLKVDGGATVNDTLMQIQ